MSGSRYYGIRIDGAKYGIGFGSALVITISYSANHSILWTIIDGILGWLLCDLFCPFPRMIDKWKQNPTPIRTMQSSASQVPYIAGLWDFWAIRRVGRAVLNRTRLTGARRQQVEDA